MERAAGWNIPLFLVFVVIGVIETQKHHLIYYRKQQDDDCEGMT